MVLPQKVIEIMQNPEVYKCGVAVKGESFEANIGGTKKLNRSQEMV